MNKVFFSAVLVAVLGWSAVAGAVQVERFTPNGAMARIMQVQVGFDGPVMKLGDDLAAAPFTIQCDSDKVKGSGHWEDPQDWVYRFDEPLQGAVSCTASPNPRFRDPQGQPLANAKTYHFSTGGPTAGLYRPWQDTIAEDQVFVLTFNAPADPASLTAHSFCEVQGLGEEVATRLITGKTRAAILDAEFSDRKDERRRNALLLQCKRSLPAGAQMTLVVGPGVSSPTATGRPAVASDQVLQRTFKVRPAFHASLTCTRMNAQAPCSPLSDIDVVFSSRVPREQAKRVVLQGPHGMLHAEDLSAEYAKDSGEAPGNALRQLTFDPPFTANATLTLEIPQDLTDDNGRKLVNADRFPLQVPLDGMPPLVKFSSGSFGIIERFADKPAGVAQTPTIPLALRHVGPKMLTHDLTLSAGTVEDHVTTDSVAAMVWLARVERMQSGLLSQRQFANVMAGRDPGYLKAGEKADIDVRSRSIFTAGDSVRKLKLPGLPPVKQSAAEIIGVPVKAPGLHIIEVASPKLGAALLAGEDATMYVRTAVLVTNLSVHVKIGRDDALVWVTALDSGEPVPGAKIDVLDCDGDVVAHGATGDDGLWHHQGAIPTANDYCRDTDHSGLFVTARVAADNPQAHGQADFAFAWSDWNKGIEPWRFNVPYSSSQTPDVVAHAVMDRTLLHRGETVSMKILVRQLTRNGMKNPAVGGGNGLPDTIRIVHRGSGDHVDIPVTWSTSPTGGVYALAQYPLPQTAHLGRYDVQVQMRTSRPNEWMPTLDAGSFLVSSFKLPVLTGSMRISATTARDATASGALISPHAIKADVQLTWQSGGAANGLPATISAVANPFTPDFPDYSNFDFGVPDALRDAAANSDSAEVSKESLRHVILDKHPVTLDAHGGAQLSLDDLPAVHMPQTWHFETTFADPNGEIQTISQDARVWPAGVVVGLQAGSWMTRGEKSTVKLLVVDTRGHAEAHVPVELKARVRTTYTTRKRLVGGFYSYDSFDKVKPLGTLCKGETDARGQLQCSVSLDHDGEIQLFASATDKQGRVSRAARAIWVWGDEAWFGAGDDDRIDVIPDKTHYKPGETAKFTVRMPFRHAEALVAVEREGVLETHVVQLNGNEPVVELPVKAAWGPNVYVSVLAVRGRIRRIPWTSFFDWGWHHPVDWFHAWQQRVPNAPEPTGLVDLAKPSFRFGLAEIHVNSDADKLQVKVSAEHAKYQVREKAKVMIQVKLPDGKPAARASVAFAAVDEALLDLKNNTSWNLLDAMRVERNYGVRTASSDGQVVGRRHYGRKAVPSGGGGGFSATRSVFNTLLLWRGNITLDDAGMATLEVPLNDSLTRFRLVAIAADGQDLFGTGSTDITVTQNVQVVSGLPQIIREGDQYAAGMTVRNRTDREARFDVTASYQRGKSGPVHSLPAQQVTLAAGTSKAVSWEMTAPLLSGTTPTETLYWLFGAKIPDKPKDQDRIAVTQKLEPKVLITVRQATLLQVKAGAPQTVPVSVAPTALLDPAGVPRGNLQVALQSSLAGSLPAVHDWLAAYPYNCLEQLSSKAVGMRDVAAWQRLMQKLPEFQTDSGLVSFFPGGHGSVILTAQLLEVTARAGSLGWNFKLPAAAKAGMIAALQQYVYGKLDATAWAPVNDRVWLRVAAVDALALSGGWRADLLDTFKSTIDNWPTPVLIDWLSILQAAPKLDDRDARIQRTSDILRARLSRHGTSLVVSDATADDGWWLMSNVTTAQARLLMTAVDLPGWKDDVSRLMAGLLSLQSHGVWPTTTANVLGVLAVNHYAQKEEQHAGEGTVEVALTAGSAVAAGFDQSLPWADMPKADGIHRQTLTLPWPKDRTGTLALTQQGEGSGWATVTARAAVPQTQAINAGMRIERKVIPVQQARAGQWSVGDTYRVQLKIHTQEPIVWLVISDPVPAGASILGGGLGRDSSIATQGEDKGRSPWDQPSFVERDAGMYRAYFEVMDAGTQTLEYTVRINTPGTFDLPPTRAEAMYQPEIFGSLPNAPVKVVPVL